MSRLSLNITGIFALAVEWEHSETIGYIDTEEYTLIYTAKQFTKGVLVVNAAEKIIAYNISEDIEVTKLTGKILERGKKELWNRENAVASEN